MDELKEVHWLWRACLMLCFVGSGFMVGGCPASQRQNRTIKRPKIRPPTIAKKVPDDAPFAHAILLNGGQGPKANFYSHMMHLRDMRGVLHTRKMPDPMISVFASDGPSSKPDLLVLDPFPPDIKFMFLYRAERAFFEPVPRLVNSEIKDKTLYPSTKWALQQFMSQLGKRLPSEDDPDKQDKQKPVFLFVTDHGERNQTWRDQSNQKIALWKDSLTVWQFHQMLRPLRHRRLVYVMSQCFSGSFVWSVFPRPGMVEAPSGNRCGFFSTLADRYAYGCYPETQKQQSTGHAHRFIRAMRGASTLNDAHERVLLTDKTPDVPLRSSDGYYRLLLKTRAKAKGMKLPAFADALLAKYASKGEALVAREEALIDALARRFSLARPRGVQEILKRVVMRQKRRKFRTSVLQSWKQTYKSLQRDMLASFYKANQGLQPKLKALYKQLMDDQSKQQSYQSNPSVKTLRKGFPTFLQTQKADARLKILARQIKLAKNRRFWTEVQEAVLYRMQVLYYRMAGKLLLQYGQFSGAKRFQRGAKRLIRCEMASIGSKKESLPAMGTLPVLKHDPDKGVPFILGISYRPSKSSTNKQHSPGAVKVAAVGMNTPAEKAGLKTGDVIVGTKGTPFLKTYELRERIMLHKEGTPFPLDIVRGTKKLSVFVTLKRMDTPNFVRLRPWTGRSVPTASLLSLKPVAAATTTTPTTASPLGKGPVLLFFWATWCGPCKSALPILRKWHAQYKQQGLRIVAVSKEKQDVLEAWYKKNPDAMPFMRMRDDKRSLSMKLRIYVAPTFIMLNNGKVTLVHKGAYKFKRIEKAMQAAIRSGGKGSTP